MKLRKLAELGLALLGVYAILYCIPASYPLFMFFAQLSKGEIGSVGGFLEIMIGVGPLVLGLVGAYVLIHYREPIAARLIPDDGHEVAPGEGKAWEAAAFRLGFVLAGAIIVASSFAGLAVWLYQLVGYIKLVGLDSFPETAARDMKAAVVGRAAGNAAKAGFGIYLMMGAPHLLRWHLRKLEEGKAAPSKGDGGEAPAT